MRGEYSGYKARVEQPYPVLGPYLKIIDKWLEDDKQRPKKKRHTAVRVYHRRQAEHDFQGVETSVKRTVREAKLRMGVRCPQVFISCDPQVGVEAEVDWGRCYAIFGGVFPVLIYDNLTTTVERTQLQVALAAFERIQRGPPGGAGCQKSPINFIRAEEYCQCNLSHLPCSGQM